MYNRYREEEKNENVNEENQEIETENVEEVQESEKSELEILKQENQRLREQYLRTLADTENQKKRIEEERARERKYASQKLLEKLVNSIDIFDKAVNMKTDDDKLNNFLIGFQMINNNIKSVLEEEGVKKIKTVGEKFDPRYHNAIEINYDENIEEDVILSEMISGYTYKDRVLRAANVIVNKKKEIANNEEN